MSSKYQTVGEQHQESRIVTASLRHRVSASPKVSVIVPAYGIADYIGESLESVFAQTLTDFEVVIVNDGSPDTEKFERAIQPFLNKIVYIKQENAGVAAARNRAIRAASGEILAFLDGDDIWLPEFLASQVEFLEKNNLDLAYADAAFFGGSAPPGQTFMQLSDSNGAVTPESLLALDCNIITSGTIARRQFVIDAGLFDESPVWKNASEDFEMWFRLAKLGGKLGYQKKVLLKYRLREGSLSGNPLQQANRTVVSLLELRKKFDLTDSEFAAWNRQMKISQALLNVEKSKDALLNGNFNAARSEIKKANEFYQSLKLTMICFALRLSPRSLQLIYKKWLHTNR